jgi:hypothetical protein
MTLSRAQMQLRRLAPRLQAIPVLEAEPGETPHSVAVFLVERGELEPEISLREERRGAAAGVEHTQRHVTRTSERLDLILKRTQLFLSPLRRKPHGSSLPVRLAQARSASMAAVARSSSAITSQ